MFVPIPVGVCLPINIIAIALVIGSAMIVSYVLDGASYNVADAQGVIVPARVAVTLHSLIVT